MIKCLQGLHPNEWLFITEYWNVLPIIKGFAFIRLEGSGELSVKDESSGRHLVPKTAEFPSGGGVRVVRLFLRDTCAVLNACIPQPGADVAKPTPVLFGSVILPLVTPWHRSLPIHGGKIKSYEFNMRAEWTTARKVLVNYAYMRWSSIGGRRCEGVRGWPSALS